MGDIANQLRRRRHMTSRSGYIHFEDPEVERVLIASGLSSDGIGVTYADAENAIWTTAIFRSNTTITAFDEFKYFKSMTYLPRQEFMNCTNLKKLTFPDSLRTYGTSIFAGAGITDLDIGKADVSTLYYPSFSVKNLYVDNLDQFFELISNNTSNGGVFGSNYPNHLYVGGREVTGTLEVPNNCTVIPYYAFRGLANITSFIIPQTVTEYRDFSFSGVGITSITIPYNVTYIGSSCFSSCSSLQTVVINANIDTLYSRTFSYCSSLSSIILPNTLKYITGSYIFEYTTSLEEITFPDSLIELSSYRMFINAGLKRVLSWGSNIKYMRYDLSSGTIVSFPPIPDTVEEYNLTFWGAPTPSYIILLPTTPPSTSIIQNFNCYRLLVPYSADHSILNAYKTAQNWSNFANRFEELNPDGTVPTT